MSVAQQSKVAAWPARVRAATAAVAAFAVMGAGATTSLAAVREAVSPPGAVVSVAGGAFLWVADDQGLLHLVGDTRALAGRPVNWSTPQQATLDQLQGASRGDPWLSTPLVKIGDAIYLPKWETAATAPTLYHVQSPADLALLGLSSQNYGQLVRDKATWEQQAGFTTDSLQRAELPAVLPPAAIASPATTTATTATSASTAAANAASGMLTHVPQFGASGDLNFDLPSGRGWSDAMSIIGLNDVLPMGTLQGEQTIAQWRVLNNSGGAFTYLQVKAIDLAPHSDIKTAQDLAGLKERFVCRDVSSCTVELPQSAVLGGVPATVVDATFVRQFGEQRTISGLSTDAGDKTADELTWRTRDVFLVKGNYGYDIRLVSTDAPSTGRLAELDQALATLQFRY